MTFSFFLTTDESRGRVIGPNLPRCETTQEDRFTPLMLQSLVKSQSKGPLPPSCVISGGCYLVSLVLFRIP